MTKPNTNKVIPLIIVLAVLIIGSLGFYIAFFGQTKESSEGTQPSVAASQKTAPQGTLLFFMNPAGSPCQEQDAIINSAKAEIEKKARIFYLKTTSPADMAAFSQYGIRSLPALILLDEKGNESKRFTPGIHSGEEILAALKTTSY